MFKKINNIIFVALFLGVFFLPFIFTRWESGGVSEEENRNLAAFPALTVDGDFNLSFTKDFETWFMDHMGFRQDMITVNKTMMQEVFDRSLTTSAWKTGKTGDSIYATDEIVKDFAHVNLRTSEQVEYIGQSYQVISDWLESKQIPFYYVQCVDKHTIYPERFIASVSQIGTMSKTDQIMTYLQENTTVNGIYLKDVLAEGRDQYDVFSHWGDPTHWTYRGAYISYRYMMERINQDMAEPLPVLQEQDYEITYKTHESAKGIQEQEEVLIVKEPKAQKQDVAVMGQWASDERHSVWKNPEAGNDKRLLIVGDSYFNNYLVDDIAESFGEVWMVWGDYLDSVPEIVELCQPDLVIFECAERVDRSQGICELAEKLQQVQ